MEPSSFKGSCLCGEVTFEIRPPFLFFSYCHCSRCRKTSGSAHAANIFIKEAQLAWLQGESFVKRFELPDAAYYCSGFCTECGSRLPWRTRNGKYYLVPAGALDDDPGCTPTRNIYWGSRAPWYEEVSTLPLFDEEPS